MMSVVIPLGGGMQCGASHFSTMVGPMCIKVTERREAHFHPFHFGSKKESNIQQHGN